MKTVRGSCLLRGAILALAGTLILLYVLKVLAEPMSSKFVEIDAEAVVAP